MFQFGMRCYERQSTVWAVGEVLEHLKDVPIRDVRKGMEGMERK